jgi:hypothetical protein
MELIAGVPTPLSTVVLIAVTDPSSVDYCAGLLIDSVVPNAQRHQMISARLRASIV